VLVDQIGELEHHLLPVERLEAAPWPSKARRAAATARSTSAARLGDACEQLAGERVDRVEGLAARAASPRPSMKSDLAGRRRGKRRARVDAVMGFSVRRRRGPAARLGVARAGCRSPMNAAARSPIIIDGALVLPPMMSGMIDASATRSRRCRARAVRVDDRAASLAGPMRQVPTG
jgi:hypothetical protein